MINTYNDIKVFLKKDVQSIFRHFSSLLGIRIAFFLPDGTAIERGVHKKSSGYCNFIDKSLGRREACLKCDKRKMEEAARRGKRLTYRCHAGLVESISPVYVSGALIGFVMMGQFRDSEKVPLRFLQTVADNESRKVLLDEYNDLTLITHDKLKSILYLFQSLVDFIIAGNMVDIKRDLTLKKAMEYINNHIDEQIALADVARHCCKSSTYITHLFKKQSGKSFKTYMLLQKLEKAEEYLRLNPEMSLSDIAEIFKFSDQFHFSKTFKRYRGLSPSAHRKLNSYIINSLK